MVRENAQLAAWQAKPPKAKQNQMNLAGDPRQGMSSTDCTLVRQHAELLYHALIGLKQVGKAL